MQLIQYIIQTPLLFAKIECLSLYLQGLESKFSFSFSPKKFNHKGIQREAVSDGGFQRNVHINVF